MVYIGHYTGSGTYTSGYFHLASVNVSVGQVVTPDTVIGYSGGVPSPGDFGANHPQPWDERSCDEGLGIGGPEAPEEVLSEAVQTSGRSLPDGGS